jgi:fatty acid-binding protein DegV
MLPHIYTIFCLQSLRYLSNTGYLDPAQAIIGEMLGVIPFFILENGKLVPVQKARSPRQIVDMLYEFICEFTDLDHIGILQGVPPYEQEIRNLRERITQTFPTTHVSEHSMGAALIATLGPHSLSVFTIEKSSPLS